MLQDVSRAALHIQAPQEFHLFLADLDHIRLGQTPEHLLPGRLQILPQGFAEIGVKGDQLAVGLCAFHRPVGGAAGRFIGQGQGAEVEHSRLLDQLQLQLAGSDAGVRSGLARKGKLPVSRLIQGHKGQGREYVLIGHQTFRLDSGLPERRGQKFSEGIRSHLAQHGGFCAEFRHCGQEIGRSAAGMGHHGGISVCVGAGAGKVDEQLAHCNCVKHVRSSFGAGHAFPARNV